MSEIMNTVIIGSGPAGCTAAVYTARAGLKPVLITGDVPGGQLTTTPEIGNWPGASDNPDGFTLMQSLSDHATGLGARFISSTVKKIEEREGIKFLTLGDGQILSARSVIACTGAVARYLGLESENAYRGRGVSACATCDGFFFRGKRVAVVGGGSAAFTEAGYLAAMCERVYLIHRREGFRAERILVDRLRRSESAGRAEFILNAVVEEILGDGERVTGLRLKTASGERVIEAAGVFIAIGHTPRTEIFRGLLEMEEDGTLRTGFGRETACSVPGFFAAGDCADRIYRQAITSAGQGCKAAIDAGNYLLERG